MPLTRPTVASSPLTSGALEAVTPPAPTSEAVASGGSVTSWTFGAFSDPDSRIASYSATLTAVVGSGSLSGSGLGPYSLTGTADGDSYTVELDALDGDGAVLATATHSVAIAATNTPVATGDFVLGGILDLDGVDQRVSLGNVPALEPDYNSTWSVAMWLNVTGGFNCFAAISSATNSDNWALFYQTSANELTVQFKTGGDNYVKTKTGALPTGWRHLMVTCDGTDMRAWVNGVEVTGWSTVTGTWPTSAATWDGTAEIWIGAAPHAPGFYSQGAFAQVAMWSTDQSSNVATVYAAGEVNLMDLASPPDAFYLPLSTYGQSESATDGIPDLSGNDYHGTGANLDAGDLEGASVSSQPVYVWTDNRIGFK